METKKVLINGYSIDYYRINTLIIGSGAASLNAAVSLHSMGQEDILISTMQWGGGTSNNAGSDKQTYYKLSLSGNEPDSVSEMALDLFMGRCMHGDIALCEAQGSVQAFMNLVRLGVKFPHDKYGAWVGYKTDNDPRYRATSAGPYTSRRMFEALGAEVKRRQIKILDSHQCISLITDNKGSNVIGAIALNTNETDPLKAIVLFNATNIVLGTGGPAGLYETSVYPVSQSGSIGMAFKAGATGQNLTESQFGIASVKFRWNLSGSYQQAVPRYFSTDIHGNGEKEFLNDYFPDIKTLIKATFLKGYQWPFDPSKVGNFGSSLIDLLVHMEINKKGRIVFIDYTRNPSWKNEEASLTDHLDQEVLTYLKNSDALKKTPVERLIALNAPAKKLYYDQGIDLAHEPLQIAVCAQHNNGGLKAGIWWESDLRHLFPVGEVNGSHGVSRPGGSALNSGQVGSYRAAQYISKKYRSSPLETVPFLSESKRSLEEIISLANNWIKKGNGNFNRRYHYEIRKRMTEAGGIIRDRNIMLKAVADAKDMMNSFPDVTGADSVLELAESFLIQDHCISHYLYVEAIRFYLEGGGRSRGSYITDSGENIEEKLKHASNWIPELCQYDRDIENKILEIGYIDDKLKINLENVREIPMQNLWFEKVWKDYIEDN